MTIAAIDSNLILEEVMFAAAAILIGVIGAALVYRRVQTHAGVSGARQSQSVGMHGVLVAYKK